MALTDNLISYWKCDEASGNLLDAHGSNDLTDTNTVGSATGKINGGRDFEATNSEYFTIADNADLSTGDIDFTFQVWINLESKVTQVILGKWPSEFLLYYDAGSDRFRLGVTEGINFQEVVANTLGSPSTATWYCIHCWHDATNNSMGIAVNAGSADTASRSFGVADGTANFTIGRNDDGATLYVDGVLDEIGFWKRVLTSDERTELYNGGSGLAYPFTVAGGNRRRRVLLCGSR